MNIVLGIYNGGYFRHTILKGNCSYPFSELIGDDWVDNSIIGTVIKAAYECDKIIFLIDGLLPNITGNEMSYTCQELITILSNPLIPISKIEFREDCKIVTPNYVMNKLNLSEELFN
jgi:hypothetical protein